MHGELVNIRLRGLFAAGGHRRPNAFRDEAVKVRSRLPEVEHAPTAFDRTRCREDQSVRAIAAHVNGRVKFVELLDAHAGELDADAYSHRSSS